MGDWLEGKALADKISSTSGRKSPCTSGRGAWCPA